MPPSVKNWIFGFFVKMSFLWMSCVLFTKVVTYYDTKGTWWIFLIPIVAWTYAVVYQLKNRHYI